MSACLRYAPMIGSRPGELSPGESRALADHLTGCPTCGALAAALTLTGGLLSDALLAEADARELGALADRILSTVRCTSGGADASRPAARSRTVSAVPPLAVGGVRWSSGS